MFNQTYIEKIFKIKKSKKIKNMEIMFQKSFYQEKMIKFVNKINSSKNFMKNL